MLSKIEVLQQQLDNNPNPRGVKLVPIVSILGDHGSYA
jgi:hypothetical protein